MPKKLLLPALAVLLLAGVDLLCGGGGISIEGGAVLMKLRIPRVLTAILAGAALAVSGTQMQAIFRNPLSDPHIMGVSAGAGLGAAIAVTAVSGAGFWLHGFALSGAAFAGAAAVSALIILLSRRIGSSTTLLIAGVMLGFIFSAGSSVLQYTANEESLKLYYSWAAGSFEGIRYGELILMAVALAAGIILYLINARGLDIILFGEDYAALAGADVRQIRRLAMVSTCLMTGFVTAFCGPVGFVGIIAPHIARRLGGTTVHRGVLPAAILYGSAISLAADILSRILPIPLPVGSTMAFIGIPVILFILLRK